MTPIGRYLSSGKSFSGRRAFSQLFDAHNRRIDLLQSRHLTSGLQFDGIDDLPVPSKQITRVRALFLLSGLGTHSLRG